MEGNGKLIHNYGKEGRSMEETKGILLGVCVLAMLLLLMSGCNGSGKAQVVEPASPAAVGETFAPVRIAVVQDATGSTTWTGTPMLQVEDLAPLINLLCRCGGELGFGMITGDSNKGLIRLVVDPPPIEPVKPPHEGNPYKAAQRREAYMREMNEFNKKLAGWKRDTEERTAKFLADADSTFKNKTLAKRTDCWDAIRRVDLFLSEDSSAWGKETRCYAMLVTDGQDNARKQKVHDMKSPAKLLIVNASGSIGDLEELKPSRFESITSAVCFIVADAERRK